MGVSVLAFAVGARDARAHSDRRGMCVCVQGQGGAVFNEGTFTASGCQFLRNTMVVRSWGRRATVHAGAQECTLTAVVCVLVCVQDQGGAVYNNDGSSTFRDGWTFSGNTAGQVCLHHTARCRGVGHWLTLPCCLLLAPAMCVGSAAARPRSYRPRTCSTTAA